MNSIEPGRPGSSMERPPFRRKYRRTLPCRSRYSLTCRSLILVMGSHAVPTVACLPRKRVEGHVDGADVPNLARVDLHRSWHSAVCNHLVEFRGRDADVHRRLVAGQTSPRDWSG